ncbi:toll/interleukin-1 receptor domain-containing protein, partial [bacterium]|nr:toll/interleukin-1 receptor domain-containing protein [bacterium]
MNEHKLKVFLCHASQDKSTVRNIYQKLLAEDWIEPWLDEKNLLPGQDWDLEIEKAVGTADVVIVFLSEHSIKKEGYVQKELSKILDKADFMPEGKIFIIPLRLDDCSIPKRLKKFHYVNYFPVKHIDLAYRRLIASLGTQKRKIYKDTDEFTDKSDLLSSRNLLSETLLFEDVDPQSEPYLNFDDSSKNVHTIKSKRKLINLGFSETQFSIYKKSIKENVDYIAWYTTIVVVSIFVVYYFIFTSINQETGTFKLLGLAISWWQAMEGLGYFVLLPILG